MNSISFAILPLEAPIHLWLHSDLSKGTHQLPADVEMLKIGNKWQNYIQSIIGKISSSIIAKVVHRPASGPIFGLDRHS